MVERKAVDWEAIEREYRAGQLSIREIARQYGVAAPTIVKKAGRLKWERDLSATVRETINAKLVKETASANGTANSPNARETVEAAAARGVDVVLRHRKDISQLDGLKARLIEKASVLLEKVADLKDLGDAATVVESLGRTMGRLIPLERQAFNLDVEDDKKNAAPDCLRLEFVKPGHGNDSNTGGV